MALPSHNSNLKWKLVLGFGVTGFVLLFLLGYNLGSLNQDTKNQTLKSLRKKAHDTTVARLRSCQKRKMDDKRRTVSESNDVRDTGDYVEILEKETLATDALSIELKEELNHCMDIRHEVDLKAENLTAIIEKLQQQNTELLSYTESAGLNRTVEQKRNVMRGRIRALRLDNKAMRNRKVQRELKIKQRRQAHEQQEADELKRSEKERADEEQRVKDEEEQKARKEEEEIVGRKEAAKKMREEEEVVVVKSKRRRSNSDDEEEEPRTRRSRRSQRSEEDDEEAEPPRRRHRTSRSKSRSDDDEEQPRRRSTRSGDE